MTYTLLSLLLATELLNDLKFTADTFHINTYLSEYYSSGWYEGVIQQIFLVHLNELC